MDILIDYLTFTSKVHSMGQLVAHLNLQDISWDKGRPYNGWTQCEYSNGIRLLSGGREDICIDMSGVGCRMLESGNSNCFDWIRFFEYLRSFGEDVNVSRLDVACDEKEGILNYETLCDYTKRRKYVSRARRRIWIGGHEEAIVWGSKTSDTRLRIYNKAMERRVEGHWMRAELQLRDEAADSMISNLLEYREVGRVYAGVLNNYLRYTTKPSLEGDRHQDRIPTASWWLRFTGTAERIPNVKVGGLEYNFDSLERFLRVQCASSMKAYITACGGNLDGLLHIIDDSRLSKKQQEMIDAFYYDRRRTLYGEEDQVEKWHKTEWGTKV